ncbi:MAG: cupin domain-containing protein [Betaproteobacteria bacterium]
MHTSLTRFAPRASLPDHEHVGIEQSWVLDGRLVDEEGECRAGQFVWRPAGNR